MADPVVVVRRATFDEEITGVLVAELIADLFERYGFGEAVAVDGQRFAEPGGHFVLVEVDGVVVGCGGFVRVDGNGEGAGDVAEVKRVYVRPTSRGRGAADAVMAELEDEATRRGYRSIRLETGVLQPEAIALYRRRGWVETERYGAYEHDEHSVCFAKSLRPGS